MNGFRLGLLHMAHYGRGNLSRTHTCEPMHAGNQSLTRFYVYIAVSDITGSSVICREMHEMDIGRFRVREPENNIKRAYITIFKIFQKNIGLSSKIHYSTILANIQLGFELFEPEHCPELQNLMTYSSNGDVIENVPVSEVCNAI
jgi:hypothetical protein